MTSYSSTRILTVPQYGHIPGVSLDDIPSRRLHDLLGKFIVLSGRNDAKSLSTSGDVGVVQLNDSLLLNIVPRFRTRNLTYMVDACNGSWVNAIEGECREYVVSQSPSDWARDLLKTQFVERCKALYSTGLLRTYRRKEVETSSPYGRIDISRSLFLKCKGITGRLACTYAERTIDNLPNSCLLLALQNSAIHSRPLHERKRMRLIQLFHGVSQCPKQECLELLTSTDRDPLPQNWLVYRELLDMATLLVDGGTPLLEDVPAHGRRLPSLRLDFQSLFESFIRDCIRKSLSGRYTVSDGNSSSGRVPLYRSFGGKECTYDARPIHGRAAHTADCDILIRDMKGRSVLMAIECKCTPLDASGLSRRSEVEQAVLYAVRFGTPFALIIHPAPTRDVSGLETPGKIGTMPILQYNFNLDAEDISEEIKAMTASLDHLLDIVIQQRPKVDADSV